jgi:L-threonylcarbamoyladenylate synthase
MVIIFPTDTVYGIGTKIFDIDGINKIYEIKKRPKDKPLACLCASLEQIKNIAVVTKEAEALINEFLPGALTVILESKPEVYNKIGYKTIGVRIPNCKIALDILKENGPMLTTSVNESGFKPINEYELIVKEYDNLVDKIYEANEPSSDLSSTVVLLANNEVKVLREGQISLMMINECLNR